MKHLFSVCLLVFLSSVTALTVIGQITLSRSVISKATIGTQAALTNLYVSDLSWTSMNNGWGPVELDKSNGEQSAGDGTTITIRSATFAKGLGVHALSNVQYDLTTVGSCSSFQATIGVDDESLGIGSVQFQVLGDAVQLYQSAVLTGVSAAVVINVNITGHNLLTLVVNDGGDGPSSDHADWGNARLSCTAVAPPPPVTGAIYMPSDAGVINVKTGYGAVGDGVHDDTANIQNAISSNINNRDSIIYFPPGTYLVSNTMFTYDGSSPHVWQGYISFQGAGQTQTTIKLKNSASGYGSAGSPKAVLFTASSGAGDTSTNPLGEGNAGFNNYIMDLTFNTGTGNPGAIGLDVLSTNNGRINNVTVISGDGAGVTGISSSRRYPGPQLFSNVTVIGFATGIDCGGGNVSTTINHVRISGQTSAGIIISGNSVFIHDLISTNNTVPAVITGEFTLGVVVDATMSGGSGTRSAIEGAGTQAQLYARNITTTGYQTAVKWQGSFVSGANKTEYYSSAVNSLWAPAKTISLGLPVQNFPVYYDPDPTHWINAATYGAVTNGSNTAAAVQAAVNACTSPKTTLYFPHGTYALGSTITIPAGNTCKRMVGYGASFRPVGTGNPSTGIVYAANSGTLVIEQINFNNDAGSYSTALSHTGTGKLAIQESHMDGQYVASSGAGDIFLDDMAFGAFVIGAGQHAWMVQLDCEGDSQHFQNHGGIAWLFGMTTEETGPVFTSTPGSSTEVLGASVLLTSTVGTDTTNFLATSTDSDAGGNFVATTQVSYVYATTGDFVYTKQISETRSGVKRTITCDGGFVCGSLPRRNNGTAVPLYTGY